MRSIAKGDLGFAGERRWLLGAVVLLSACGAGTDEAAGVQSTAVDVEAAKAAAAPNADGLADAYDVFLETFENNNFDADYRIGYGFHPGLNTEKVRGPGDRFAAGQALLEMNTGRVFATLDNVPDKLNFDLWFVKNEPGGTAAPEAGDTMFKVGKFSSGGNNRTLDVTIGVNIAFDLDQLVVTRAGKKPNESRIAVGERTLFEKRLFRFRQGTGLDPVTGALANNIETADPLVARGAHLFFNETFGGNGRTCGTCHRAEANLTIDPAFIATLPQSDPLFIAENNPALAELEDPALLRSRALIRENLDGFDDPTNQFVMRGVPHTLALGLTSGIGNAFFGAPPDHRLGWSGDGGPGRSSLHAFAFGAVVQHFTKDLARRPGVDFRIPTQEELDALEAFQLFTGRQKPSDFSSIFPTDERALSGQGLFNNVGCTFCHNDTFGFVDSFNANFDTGVANLTPELIADDGFGTPGDGTFNVPSLVEAADTPPFFHNNAVDTIEDAVGFYFSPTFQASPSSFFIFQQLETEQQGELAAFLRVINSAANIDQVKKRVEYVKLVRSTGNTDILKIALADAEDARQILADKELSPDVQEQLATAEKQLKKAISARDRDRSSIMNKLLDLLGDAREALFTTTPPNGGSGGGSMGGFAGTFGEGGEGPDPGGAGGSFTAGSFTGGSGTTGGSSSSGGAGPIGGSP